MANLLQRGDAAFDSQDFETALAVYLDCDQKFPNEPKVLVSLSATYAELGRSKEGMEALDRAIALEPERLRDAPVIHELRRKLQQGTPAVVGETRPPNHALLELKIAARDARLTVEAATKATQRSERVNAFARAREVILPVLSQFEHDFVEPWIVAAIISLEDEDRDLAALAYEGITRLDPQGCLEEPLLTLIAQLRGIGAADRLEAVRAARATVRDAAARAAQGDEAAIGLVARAFAVGEGVPCNPKAARKWVMTVAEASRPALIETICDELFTQADARWLERHPPSGFRIQDVPTRERVSPWIIANAYALSGDLPAAIATSKSYSTFDVGDDMRRLATIAAAENRRGGREAAIAMLRTAGGALNERTTALPLNEAVVAQAALGMGWQWLGMPEDAKSWIDAASSNALKDNTERRACLLAETAIAVAALGDAQRALALADEAERFDETLPESSTYRRMPVPRIEFLRAFAGDVPGSIRVARAQGHGFLVSANDAVRALVARQDVVGMGEVIDALRSDAEQSWRREGGVDREAGQIFADGGNETVATTTALLGDTKLAIKSARAIATPNSRARAISTIGQVERLAGHFGLARSLEAEAVDIAPREEWNRFAAYSPTNLDNAWMYAHAARVAREVRGLEPKPVVAADWVGFWW